MKQKERNALHKQRRRKAVLWLVIVLSFLMAAAIPLAQGYGYLMAVWTDIKAELPGIIKTLLRGW